MWFAFGLITLLTAFAVSLFIRLQARWVGVHHEATQRIPQYEQAEESGKYGLVKVRIGVCAPAGFQFCIRAESPRDRFFKRIGISVEMQMLDPLFDDALYLESDTQALGQLLAAKKDLRHVILNAFLTAHSKQWSRVSIRCARGRLWMELAPANGKVPFDGQAVVAYLHELSQGLSQSGIPESEQRDPFVRRASILLAASTATLIFGIVGAYRSLGSTDILEWNQLFFTCAMLGIAGTGLLAFAVMALLGRSSRTHLVLVEGLLVGGMGLVLALFSLARDANMDLDQAAATTYELPEIRAEHVINRSSGKGSRKSHNFYLHTRDWRSNRLGSALSLDISQSTYETLINAKSAKVHVKPGALGYEWIEKIEPGKQSSNGTVP